MLDLNCAMLTSEHLLHYIFLIFLLPGNYSNNILQICSITRVTLFTLKISETFSIISISYSAATPVMGKRASVKNVLVLVFNYVNSKKLLISQKLHAFEHFMV